MNASFAGRSQPRVPPADVDAQIKRLAVRYSRRLVSWLSLPAHEQEDLQQDIHLALWLSWSRLDDSKGAPSTFLRRVAENEARTIVTRRRAARRDDRKRVELDQEVGQRADCDSKNPFRREKRTL